MTELDSYQGKATKDEHKNKQQLKNKLCCICDSLSVRVLKLDWWRNRTYHGVVLEFQTILVPEITSWQPSREQPWPGQSLRYEHLQEYLPCPVISSFFSWRQGGREAEAWHLLVPHQLLLSQAGVEASNLEYVNYIAHSTPYNTLLLWQLLSPSGGCIGVVTFLKYWSSLPQGCGEH